MRDVAPVVHYQRSLSTSSRHAPGEVLAIEVVRPETPARVSRCTPGNLA